MLENTTQALLDSVSIINYEFQRTIEATGEKFNIFNVLKLNRNEVRTHSAFIGELLNPNGSHGFNELFLKLFCEELKIENFNHAYAIVNIEENTGQINKEKTEGGNIDIIIRDNQRNAIIIENKIDAKDQENQLLRYHNFGMKHFDNFKLCYLTIRGNEPSEFGRGGLNNERFTKISYHTHIINWLETCKKIITSHSILRETITQYIYLLKMFTNQSKYDKMTNDIANIIVESKYNFMASMLIANEFNKTKNKLLQSFWDEIKESLEESKEVNLQEKIFFHKTIEQDCPALFIKSNSPNILFGIEPLNGKHFKPEFNNLFIGMYSQDNNVKDKNAPFPQWYKCEKLGYHFGDINLTLGEILNSSQRKEIKYDIITKIKEFILNNETTQPNTNTNTSPTI